ncbi:MAG: phosphomannomutase/phosphoglucomutase [Planctomycetota bacterium]
MSIFKAYDIRGLYETELNLTTAREIGAAFARFLSARRIVVVHDMRASSPDVTEAVIAGICSQGADVIDCGLGETPFGYFAVGHLAADGGLIVTASHNPAQYTGMKMVREKAIPISGDTGIREIEQLVSDGVPAHDGPAGRVETIDLAREYARHVSSFMKPWQPLQVVIDFANGMGGHMLPGILDAAGLSCKLLYPELDGSFPNHEANPLRDENIVDLCCGVIDEGADLGVAFDGDADRCVFVNEKGERVPSDIVTAMIARSLVPLEPGTAVVFDLRSSDVVREEIVRLGGRPIRERVGHSFMKATLRREGGLFGGELSGHFYFRENFYSDSGIIAMVEVLNILSRESRPFSEVASELQRYPSTGEINFMVEDKDGVIRALSERYVDGQIDYLDGITVRYPGFWFNVRKSNTEPLLRLCLEATQPELFDEKRQELLDFLGEPM